MSDQFPSLVSLPLEGILPAPIRSATLTAADAETAQAILTNMPLPARDVSFLDCRLSGEQDWLATLLPGFSSLPAQLDFSSALSLSSPLAFSAAMEAAGLHPSWPGPSLFPPSSSPCRYVVLSLSAAGAGKSAFPIPLPPPASAAFSTNGAALSRLAFLAAVPQSLPAALQLSQVFGALQSPFQFSPARRLPASTAIVAHLEANLRARASSSFGYNLNWLREVAAGRLLTDYGVKFDASSQASLHLDLAGSFVAVFSSTEDGWLRFRLFRQQDRALAGRVDVTLGALPQGHALREPQQLLAAILGILPQQWLTQLHRSLLAPRLPAPAAAFLQPLGASPALVAQILERWQELDAELALFLWDHLADNATLALIRDWTHRIAEAVASPDSLLATLASHNPHSSPAPLSRFLALLPGVLPGEPLSEDRLLAIATQARRLAAILNQDSWLDILRSLRRFAFTQLAPERIWAALGDLSSYQSLPAWIRELIESTLGAIRSPSDLAPIAKLFPQLERFTTQLLPQAAKALSARYSAQLAFLTQSSRFSSALLDCSFAYDDAGMAALRLALSGDLTALLALHSPSLRLHSCSLLEGLTRHSRLELHLPFLDRKQWESRIDALAGMQVESGPDGRLLVYNLEATSRLSQGSSYQSVLALAGTLPISRNAAPSQFTLSFTDTRRLPACQLKPLLSPLLEAYGFPASASETVAAAAAQGIPLDVSFSLYVPGNAVAIWTEAPPERTERFRTVYSRVSLAVQAALRRWLPYVYFSDPARYGDLLSAFSLLVYSCSRPTVGASKFQLTYDPLCPDSLNSALRSSLGNLRRELRRISSLLEQLSQHRTARFYLPENAERILHNVATSPRLFQSLLVADAFFLDQLIKLGNQAARLRAAFNHKPSHAVRELLKFSEEFVKTFHGKLRRLYGGRDFLAFGPLILMEAGKALRAAIHQEECPLQGVVELRPQASPDSSFAATFVNDAWQPWLSF